MCDERPFMKQQRILFLLYYFAPIKSIAVNRNWAITHYLRPYFEQNHVFTTSNNQLFPKEPRITEGVAITEIPTYDYRTFTHWLSPNRLDMHHSEGTKQHHIVNFLIRVLDSFPLWYSIISFRRAARLIRREKITHIYSSFRPMSDHFTAYLLKIRFPHLIWIADFRDLHTHPILKNVILPSFQHWCTQKIVRRATLLTTVSQGLADHLIRYNPRTYVLKSGIEWSKTQFSETQYPLFTVAYTGSMYQNESDPTLLLQVVDYLVKKNILTAQNFQIVYAGKDAAKWEEYITQFNLNDFFNSKGLVTTSEAITIQRKSHLNMVLSYASEQYKGDLSGKIYEYFAAQNPIIVLIKGVNDPEFDDFIANLTAGCVVYHNRSFDILLKFFMDKFVEWQQTGRVAPMINMEKLKELEWSVQVKALMEVLLNDKK